MKAKWENPVSYHRFTVRLKNMTLADAIETPRVEYQVRDHKPKTPIQDGIRRVKKLKEENIPILTFEEIEKFELDSANTPVVVGVKEWWFWDKILNIFK